MVQKVRTRAVVLYYLSTLQITNKEIGKHFLAAWVVKRVECSTAVSAYLAMKSALQLLLLCNADTFIYLCCCHSSPRMPTEEVCRKVVYFTMNDSVLTLPLCHFLVKFIPSKGYQGHIL